MTFQHWPSWLARSPFLRRGLIKLRRALWRAERATFANAVLVALEPGGDRVLILLAPRGGHLPRLRLDAWAPIATQVETWAAKLLPNAPIPAFVAIAGAPGAEGVSFLYSVKVEAAGFTPNGSIWLDREATLPQIGEQEHRLLALCL